MGGLAAQQSAKQLAITFAAIKAIGDEETRAGALAELAQYLDEPLKKDAFRELLDIAHSLTRSCLLNALRPFLEVIAGAGGPQSLLDFRRSIHETATWYP